MISVTVVRTISFSIYQRAKYTADDAIMRMTGKSPLALANATNSCPSIYTTVTLILPGVVCCRP
jgi:hypothetical protein